MKPLLIESWLPIEAIGAESQRERGASSALPPLYFLHVWWARRPLTASRAAILASVLPQWNADFPAHLREKFPNEATYHQWVEFLIGIRGDPVKGRKLVTWAKDKGIKLDFHPYGGAPRAFTVNPSTEDLQTMGDLLEWTWGKRDLSVLDSFAGGGSIPFESLRYGFITYASDLNPVAAVILKATLDYPARFGPALSDEIRKWGRRINEIASDRLSRFFPMPQGERIRRYLWARTVVCPSTGKLIPLSPNWWLSKEGVPFSVHLIVEPEMENVHFEIIRGEEVSRYDPNVGTISRGIARSPWTGETISGDYIKAEAQAGRMAQIIYALSIQTSHGYDFRAPTAIDLEAVHLADLALAESLPRWEANGLLPNESVPVGLKTSELHRYGMSRWVDLFSPRQLLTLLTYYEVFAEIKDDLRRELGEEKSSAVETYIAFILSKCANYNSRLSIWHPLRATMANTFDRHDFGFAWSHGEMTLPNDGFLWAVDQITDAYKGLSKLSNSVQRSFWSANPETARKRLEIHQVSASNLSYLGDNTIEHICLDPPYYDNVQYAELSDFFYVWLKRSVGHLYPEFFRDELTNKDDEAVANPARFKDLTPGPSPKGRGGAGKAKELAEKDYENKMTAAFREMYRVLRPDGSLTVMFTHKRVEAWDTLASALIGAGFAIKASWPVHTESEHSLHQAKKNAARSTILLVCRKRTSPPSPLLEGEGGGG